MLGHDTLPRLACDLPPPLAPARLAQLARRLIRQEHLALAAARQTLTDPATTRLTLSLLRTTLALPGPAEAQPKALGLSTLARQALRRDVKQVRRRLTCLRSDLAGDSDPAVRAADWHHLRIAIKRLRYDLDVLRPLLREADEQRWTRRLLPLQDALGMLNDSNVGIARLQSLASDPLTIPAMAWLHGRSTGLQQTLPALLAPLADLPAPRLKKSA